jgi:putative ABC transport system substrate-binding protein
MRRREFITLLGGAAAACPLAARVQQSAMPVIGFLNSASPGPFAYLVRAFHRGLAETGYVEGQNVAIEYRWADGQYDRLTALAGDLVHRKVSVLAATSTPANVVAKAATNTIPIVFTTSSDPVQLGLAGVTQLNVEVAPKRLELAHELFPTATLVALLINPNNPSAETVTRNLQDAALTLGLQLHILRASSEPEIDDAFTAFPQRASVLLIGTDAFFNSRRRRPRGGATPKHRARLNLWPIIFFHLRPRPFVARSVCEMC